MDISRVTRYKKTVFFLLALYFFMVSINLMGASFKMFGTGFASRLIETTSNPLVGLFIGILATSIIQSSSSTTSVVVGLVAGGMLPITNAIPIIMGANIGTTVTNIIVSLGYVARKKEFKLAFAGSTVHDFFNILAVLILFPLELMTHFLEKSSIFLSDLFVGIGGLEFISPLEYLIEPAVFFVKNMLFFSPIPILIFSVVMLFASLKMIVTLMKSVVVGRIESIIDSYLFRTSLTAFAFGIIFTAIVQSSSVTTSIMVPLVAAGILTVRKIFPYVLGANVGTTVTAILASLATANPAAVTIAFSHLLFNVLAICILYPLKIVPITIAERAGSWAMEHRKLAIFSIILMFYILPVALIIISR